MTILKAQVTLPYRTGLPEDVIVNTFAFSTTGDFAPPGSAQAVANALVTFYGAIDVYLGDMLSNVANAGKIRVYDLTSTAPGPDDDVLGSPEVTQDLTVVTGTSSLPPEVAVCLSYNAVLTDVPEEDGVTRPASRRRGRVFIGPLAQNTIDQDSSRRAMVTPALMTALLDAADAMQATLAATLPDAIIHAVYSPTDNIARPVVQYFIDNAFDTMRGRGLSRTVRSTRVV
jgi:hypothetical protein